MIQIQLQRYDPHAALEASGSSKPTARFEPFGEDGLTFRDLIDLVNPLQHIPVLSTVYRKLTGDTIDPAMRVAGGALFGGPIGAAVSMVAVAVAEARKGPTPPEIDPDVADRRAIAVVERPPVSPGGWMVANAKVEGHGRTIDVGLEIAAEPDQVRLGSGREIRRGGWMVIHAYGAVDVRAPDEHRSRVAGTVDLAV